MEITVLLLSKFMSRFFWGSGDLSSMESAVEQSRRLRAESAQLRRDARRVIAKAQLFVCESAVRRSALSDQAPVSLVPVAFSRELERSES